MDLKYRKAQAKEHIYRQGVARNGAVTAWVPVQWSSIPRGADWSRAITIMGTRSMSAADWHTAFEHFS